MADHMRSVLDQLTASGVLPSVGPGSQSPAAQPVQVHQGQQHPPLGTQQAQQDAGASCDVPPPPPLEQPPPQAGAACAGGLSSVSGTTAQQGGCEGAKEAHAEAAHSGSHRGGGAHPRPAVRPRPQHPQPHGAHTHGHNPQQPELKQAYEVQLEAYFHLHGSHQTPNGNTGHGPSDASGNSYSRPWGAHTHGTGGSSLVWTRQGGAGHRVQGVGQGQGEAQEQGQGRSRGQGHRRGHGQGQGQIYGHGHGHGHGQGQEHGSWGGHQGQAEAAVVLDPPPPWRYSHAVSSVGSAMDMHRAGSGQHGGGAALLADQVLHAELQHHQQLSLHHNQHQQQLHHQERLSGSAWGPLGAGGGGQSMSYGTGGAGGVHAPVGGLAADAGTGPGVHAPGLQHPVSLHTNPQPQVQAHAAGESTVQQAAAGAAGAPADVAGGDVPPGFARPLRPPYARGGLYRRRPGKQGEGDPAAGRHPHHQAGAHGVGSEVRLGAPRGVRGRGFAVGADEEGEGEEDGPDEDLAGAVDLLRQEQEHDPQER